MRCKPIFDTADQAVLKTDRLRGTCAGDLSEGATNTQTGTRTGTLTDTQTQMHCPQSSVGESG